MIAVRAVQFETQAVVALRLRAPQLQPEAARPAVQAIGAVVGRQRMPFAVDPEGRIRDPVAITAHDHAEMRIAQHVVLQRRQPQHDVGELTAGIGDLQPRDDPAIGDGRQPQSAAVVHRVLVNRPPVGQVTVDLALHRCHGVRNR